MVLASELGNQQMGPKSLTRRNNYTFLINERTGAANSTEQPADGPRRLQPIQSGMFVLNTKSFSQR